MSQPRILVAGIGNVLLGDDAFGVEVVRRLAQQPQPEGVCVVDFGIRGFDLAYAPRDGFDRAILIDATRQGQPRGTLYVIEPNREERDVSVDQSCGLKMRSMNPVNVLRLVRASWL